MLANPWKTLGVIAIFGAGTAMLATTVFAQEDENRRAQRAAEIFEQLDADGDGSVTQAEIEAARSGRFGEMDANGDGEVTEEELTAHIEARSARRVERAAAEMLSRNDANSDGVLTEDELGQSERGARRFEQVDTDGDGVVTREEFDTAVADRSERFRGRGKGRGDGPRRN
ncbi:MAG: EF-hand domain-containing protein [Pseudomonadota bacterium]